MVVSAADARRWREERQYERVKAQIRAGIVRRIQRLYLSGVLSGVAYDLLQAELSRGQLPDVYVGDACGHYLVWSDHERLHYSLGGWEAHAQALLPVADPAKETARLIYYATEPPEPSEPPARRPWAAALDSCLDPMGRDGPPTTPAPASRALAHPLATPRITPPTTPVDRGVDRGVDRWTRRNEQNGGRQ